ncbi:hypothetical protein JCM8547_000403 [Rhodosporidiobolus lusitaniae]
MHVFVTGASGWIGSHVVPELLSQGHTVLALARNDKAAAKLDGVKGVEVHRGSLDDLESLKEGARKADGIIHLAFKHDFENWVANGDLDASIVSAICSTLEGTDKPFVIASGAATFAMNPTREPGKPVTEDEPIPEAMHNLPRVKSERALHSFSSKGVRTAVVRLPPTVHGKGDSGFVPALVSMAKQNQLSPFATDETTQPTFWPGVHVEDAAAAFRLALEKSPTASTLHAVGDGDGLSVGETARLIGEKLDVPVKQVEQDEAGKYFGFLARFATLNLRVSTDKTKEVLGWQPVKPTLKQDLKAGFYF